MKKLAGMLSTALILLISACVTRQHGYFTGINAPPMAEVQAGSFNIGEGGNWPWANGPRPIQKITIGYDYFISKEPITVTDWDECVKNKICEPLDAQNRGHDAALVSWDGTQTYISWLNNSTGKNFRLPSESEWEYAIKGPEPLPDSWFVINSGKGMQMTRKSYVNNFGLYPRLGMHGEWVEDCWNNSYSGIPLDGAPRAVGDCQKRTFRNRTGKDDFIYMVNGRYSFYKDVRGSNITFRIVHPK